MDLDQAHGGGVRVRVSSVANLCFEDMDSPLRRWEVAGP